MPALKHVLPDMVEKPEGLGRSPVLTPRPAEELEELAQDGGFRGKFHCQPVAFRLADGLPHRFVAARKQSGFISSQFEHMPMEASGGLR